MNNKCNYKQGSLSECSPLAMAYVPLQESVKPSYKTGEALSRGTLFPGLDLPFMNMLNTGDLAGTPLGELMAFDFVEQELALYLDTHSSDQEAFEMYKSVCALAQEARERYTTQYGPVSRCDVSQCKSYTWLKNPWPWDYKAGMEG